MSEVELLSALIADIYDTALNVTSWPEVLAKITAFVPGCGCNLFSQDALYSIAQVHYSWGDDPHYVQLYFDKYIKMNPFFPAIAFDEVGRVGVQSDIISFEEFHQTQFYREWAAPQGYIDCLYSVLDKSQTGCAMITVRRHSRDGLADAEACRRMGLVVPHVRRAVLISRALEHTKTAGGDFMELLDKVSAGIFLLSADCRLSYANQAGESFLAERSLFTRRSGKLVVLDDVANQSLASALAEIRKNPSNAAEGVSIPVTGDAVTGKSDQRYVAHVLPMTSGLRRHVSAEFAAVAAVFVRKAGVGWGSPVEVVARLYKLTPGEIRVLLAIVEEEGTSQVASTLGISEETVRTHLRHIYDKTGKRRQTELVKLLAEYIGTRP